MKRIRIYLILLFIYVSGFSYSQTTENVQVQYNQKFSIGYTIGSSYYHGDVNSQKLKLKFSDRYTGQFDLLQYSFHKNLDFRFSIYNTTLYGDESLNNRFINFKSNINIGKILADYKISFLNFYLPYKRLSRKENITFVPYISFGVGILSFMTYGDILDNSGRIYYLWSDDKLYNIPETSKDITMAKQLNRDYIYETNLRDLNVDKLGKYKQYAFVLPFELGEKIRLTDRLSFKFSYIYHLPFTDMIDNISNKSIGNRKGNASFDSFFSFNGGLIYNFKFKKLSPQEIAQIELDYQNLNGNSSLSNDNSNLVKKLDTTTYDVLASDISLDTLKPSVYDTIEIVSSNNDDFKDTTINSVIKNAHSFDNTIEIDSIGITSTIDSAQEQNLMDDIIQSDNKEIKDSLVDIISDSYSLEETDLELDSLDDVNKNSIDHDSVSTIVRKNDTLFNSANTSDRAFIVQQEERDSSKTEVTEMELDMLYQSEDAGYVDKKEKNRSNETAGQTTLPAKFIKFDLNKNGIIEKLEVDKAVDALFEFQIYKAKELRRLIDYYYGQNIEE